MKGKVKWYNARKGYGFISGEDDEDVFVHSTDVPQGTLLKEEDEVEYEVEKTDKGLKAVDLVLL
jgi:CspA family cold shock protein